MNKPIIFLDMDGVLVDMVSGAFKSLNITDYKIPPMEYDMTKWEGVNLSTRDFWDAIDKTNEHFWANLDKYLWSDELVKLCEQYGDLFILTAPSRNPYCLAGKMMWIKKYYPQLVRKIIITPHKYLCAARNRILIDDTDAKIEKFAKHGGKTILFPQLWNKNYKLVNIDKIEFLKYKFDELRVKKKL